MFAVFSHQVRGPGRRRPAMGLLSALLRLDALRRQRRQLRDLDDAQLADIGLTRHQAELESRRPAWDVPAAWRR